jgi:anaerobic selenocysteine-containing dehydrogenase
VALQDIQNDPDRLRQPMRAVGSEWQPIEWDDAFTGAERLAAIQERHGQNAVAVYQGNPSVHNYGLMTHSNYFLGLLKTRNRFSATSVDQLPHHLTSHLMYGHGLLLPIPDIDHTDFMLILGGNPLASNGSIMTVPDVEKRLKAIQAGAAKWWWSTRGAAKRRRWPISICSCAPVAMRRCCSAAQHLVCRRPDPRRHLPVNGPG